MLYFGKLFLTGSVLAFLWIVSGIALPFEQGYVSNRQLAYEKAHPVQIEQLSQRSLDIMKRYGIK